MPTSEELKRLPLCSLVALATRCALRSRSLFTLPNNHPNLQKYSQDLDIAIKSAEDILVNGKGDDSQEFIKIAIAAQDAADVAKKVNFFHASQAAQSAALAAAAARAAATNFGSSNDIFFEAFNTAKSTGADFNQSLSLNRGNHTIRYTLGAITTTQNALNLIGLSSILNDYKKLVEISKGTYIDLGQSIDIGDFGPLGPLWPKSKPIFYTVEDTHPFFDEIVQFHVSTLTFIPLILWPIIESKLGKSKVKSTNPNRYDAQVKDRIHDINIMLSRLPQSQVFTDSLCDEELIFDPRGAVVQLLDSNIKLPYLIFALQPIDPQFKESNNSILNNNLLNRSLETFSCYLLGGAFENKQKTIKSRYGKNLIDWPLELQFFYHLRNGCFHRNKFNITKDKHGKDKIQTSNPPKWHTYIMPSDAEMNHKGKAINDWFRLPHVLPFLHDIGKLLS